MITNQQDDTSSAQDGEFRTPGRVRNKRHEPDSGLSPQNMNAKKPPVWNTSSENDPGANATQCKNANATQGKNGNEAQSRYRYSFIIEGPNELDLPRMDKAVGMVLEKSSTINFSRITANKKAVLYRTQNPHGDPSRDLNWLLKQENLDNLRHEYGENSLTITHHDPTSRRGVKREQTHAIAKSVPVEYTEEEFLNYIIQDNPSYVGRVVKCSRIGNNKLKRPSMNMRIICADKATSDLLISEGLKIGSRFFRCDKPHPTPEIQQCFKCQEFGHEVSSCTGNQHCAKCGEGHRTKGCTKQRESYVCINCGEAHAAWYTRCKKYQIAVDQKKKEDEDKKKSAPSAQPLTVGTMRNYKKELQTGQLKSQQQVEKVVDETRKEWDDKIEDVKTMLNKKIDDRFDELKAMIEGIYDKITSQSPKPLSPGGESSIHKLHNKLDSYKTKLELIEAKLSTQPTKFKEEVESTLFKKLDDHKDKIQKKIAESKEETKNMLDEQVLTIAASINEETQNSAQSITEKLDEMADNNQANQVKLNKLKELVSELLLRHPPKHRGSSVPTRSRTSTEALTRQLLQPKLKMTGDPGSKGQVSPS